MFRLLMLTLVLLIASPVAAVEPATSFQSNGSETTLDLNQIERNGELVTYYLKTRFPNPLIFDDYPNDEIPSIVHKYQVDCSTHMTSRLAAYLYKSVEAEGPAFVKFEYDNLEPSKQEPGSVGYWAMARVCAAK